MIDVWYIFNLSLTSICYLSFSLEPPALGIIFKADNPEISAKPVQFTKVSHIVGKGFDEVFFWYPIAPPGYASLGCMVSRTDEAPSLDMLCCPRMDLVNQANILETPISRSSSSRASHCWSIWKVENQVKMNVHLTVRLNLSCKTCFLCLETVEKFSAM